MPRRKSETKTTKRPRTKLHPPRVKPQDNNQLNPGKLTKEEKLSALPVDNRKPLKYKFSEERGVYYYNDIINYQVWEISKVKKGKYLVTGYSYKKNTPKKYIDSGTTIEHECGVEIVDNSKWNVTWPGTLDDIMMFPMVKRSTLTKEDIELCK